MEFSEQLGVGIVEAEGNQGLGPLPEGERRNVEVVIIREGVSKNGYFYGAEVLRALAPLVEGARAYADHSAAPVRSVRDVVGYYTAPRFVEGVEGTSEVPSGRTVGGRSATSAHLLGVADNLVAPILAKSQGRSATSAHSLGAAREHGTALPQGGRAYVAATLHIFEEAAWLWRIIKEALAEGKPDVIGLSVDLTGRCEPRPDGSKAVEEVLAFNSCDIVTTPSAGGAFTRILQHAHRGQEQTRGNDADGPLFLAQKQHRGQEQARGNDGGARSSRPERREMEQAIVGSPNGEKPVLPDPVLSGTNRGEKVELGADVIQEASAALAQVREARQELARLRAEAWLEQKLAASILPRACKEKVRRQFEGRVFESAELDHSLELEQMMMAELSRSGLITGMGYEKPTVSGMVTGAERLQKAFDQMFGIYEGEKVPELGGIREAYYCVTGDASCQTLSERSTVGSIRVSEAAPLTRITEADTTTATFSYLLGTSMNKRLLKDYQAWPAEWLKFVTVVPIKDFKQQTRVRLGAFGSLSTVAEDTPYTTISLTDTAATYVPTKRGNLVQVSRETIVNDDLHAIKQIPTKLAVAAAYTLAEFVYAFLSGNPTIYDGNALFLTGAPHTNLGASALSSAAMQAGVIAMREQTNYAGKRIGLRPKFLVVPPELEFTAAVILRSAGIPGSNNNDINPMMGYMSYVVAPQLTSVTQWFLAADPLEVDTIEVGFVGGQMNPALFIQDQPLYGLNFTQDVISYKIRHEYGGAVTDWRGLYRGI